MVTTFAKSSYHNHIKALFGINQMWGKIKRFILKIILLFFALSIVLTILYRWMPVKYTPLMMVRYFQNIDNDKYHSKKQWVSINKISYNVILAVIASEDNKFMDHKGFDWNAIKRAREQNKTRTHKLGASSITQQTAKNVFLFPSRTWFRKGLEAYFTILIELFWSKERILEVYLNVIETGDGIYGIEEAANIYFKKKSHELTEGESALIAAILPNPRQRNPKKPTKYLLTRKNKIESLMGLVPKPKIKAYGR